MHTIHLLITGKVQGVFYRASAKDVADRLGLKGWIRNTKEGDVEAVVTGEQNEVMLFARWCRQGPPRADVEDVIVTEKPEEGFADFVVERGKK